MIVALLPDEEILWQGKPVRRSVFLRGDWAWVRFSLKFNAVAVVVMAAILFALNLWLVPEDLGFIVPVLIFWVVADVAKFAEPFAWRYFTLPRTTYYVTNQRVLSVPGRRMRATKLAEIDHLRVAEGPDGSGHLRIDRRIMPDGIGNGTVAELIHVPGVRKVADLLSRLTGQQPVNVD